MLVLWMKGVLVFLKASFSKIQDRLRFSIKQGLAQLTATPVLQLSEVIKVSSECFMVWILFCARAGLILSSNLIL